MEYSFEHNHKDLIELCKTGNQLAMYRLYQLYSRAMFNICYRMMNNREEAQDMLQDAFTEAFRNLSKFAYESTFGAWLRRIVVNRCINAINKRKINVFFPEEIEDHDVGESTESDHNLDYEVEQVRKGIEALPDGYRVVFSLYALEGYDHAEISEILKITESTSKTQYLRAKLKLKEIIKLMNYGR